MSIIDSKYRRLGASIEYLTDITVLAQAWKKTHQYIRRHNWYANVLELDESSFNLEARLEAWAAEIVAADWQPEPLRLVPAPKNTRWEFRERLEVSSKTVNFLEIKLDELGSEPSFNDWRPKAKSKTGEEDNALKLRPLAHVSIRDQTISTAVMLCLADVVETAQYKPPEQDELFKPGEGCVSYGNRLHCVWQKNGSVFAAEFAWGNSRSYSDYFEHYRQFLARPIKVCRAKVDSLRPDQELYIIKLDLQAFFDKIDRNALYTALVNLETEHRTQFGAQEVSNVNYLGFWDVVVKSLNWHWGEDDTNLAPLISSDESELPKGLPQGLVASGFLANAYLVEFDRDIQKFVAKEETIDVGIKILDYSRYVDDLRVVVSAPSNFQGHEGLQKMGRQVADWVQKILDGHLARIGAIQRLKVNDQKTEVQPYRSTSTQGSLSVLMQSMKAGLSGTFDLDTLVNATGGLDGLLWLSEQLSSDNHKLIQSRLRLATITTPTTDVRDDTVKRFVATRLSRVLRERLAMEDGEPSTSDGVELADKLTSAKIMSHEFETTARKLIKVWSENPSLVLLLRCSLDLFPHPRILLPVIEALELKLDATNQEHEQEALKQVKVAQYVISDLLRAAAVETSFRVEEEYPEGVDIPGYRQTMASFAKRLLKNKQTPWYLQQQAYFFLSSRGDVSVKVSLKSAPTILRQHLSLQKAMRYMNVTGDNFLSYIPLALIVQQIQPAHERFAAWLCEQMESATVENQQAAIRLLAMNAPELLLASLDDRSQVKTKWRKLIPSAMLDAHKFRSSGRVQKSLPSQLSLLRAISSQKNPFSNENSVLSLACALLRYMLSESKDAERTEKWMDQLAMGLSIEHIELQCSDWEKIDALPDESIFTVSEIHPVPENYDSSLYAAPSWIEPKQQWLYGLGRILRSAITGEFDFTARRYLVTEDVHRYSGLRSTWFQRRFSLLNTGRGLLAEPTPVTPWLSGLLSGLLQWPGTKLHSPVAQEIGRIRSPQELLNLLEKQVVLQRLLYGSRSKTPFYVMPTSESSPVHRPLRIAVVQTMRPRVDEFDEKDPIHWTPGVLAQHRRHLAEVCNLARANVKAWASARVTSDLADDDHLVDIVLFPELSVHPEHIGFLRRLSDTLKAHVFTGLTFLESKAAGGVINTGLWLIRTESKGDGRRIDYVWQGKKYPMKDEVKMGIKPYRPHLTLIELPIGVGSPTRIAAVVCYDATDLELIADLRDRSDLFMVAAMNKDVRTFDNMVGALNFHMYQPVVLANSGEFGGSTAQAPFPGHAHMIAHLHGGNQVAVGVFEIEPWHFKGKSKAPVPKDIRSPPAGYLGRPRS